VERCAPPALLVKRRVLPWKSDAMRMDNARAQIPFVKWKGVKKPTVVHSLSLMKGRAGTALGLRLVARKARMGPVAGKRRIALKTHANWWTVGLLAPVRSLKERGFVCP
jgi:hypothetical protein